MLSYLSESKRLKLDHIQQELGYVAEYPNLAAGLATSNSS
jgi:hypothetical protein